jgi:hypothetical protein
MSDQNFRKFRSVNSTLGKAPSIGPFPAEQVVPWTAIFLSSYYVCKVIFGLSWLWTVIIAAWGMSTWWVLTGSKSWRFLSKFVSTPNWTRGYARYQRVIDINSLPSQANKKRRQSLSKKRLCK